MKSGTKMYSGPIDLNDFPGSCKQSSGDGEPASVYDMIHSSVNKDAFSMRLPKKIKDKAIYLFLIPLTLPQFLVIPNPIKKPTFYPLSLFLSIVFIWGYTFLIVWWTYSVTWAFNLHYSIIPMVLFPFGISVRDRKKFIDFKIALDVFTQELED